jgi:hypothetical protein
LPAVRAHLTLIEDSGRIQATSSAVDRGTPPAAWQYLQGWLDEGWFPIGMTGNGERDFAVLMEQHWGDPMRLAAFVAVKEKDDGTIKIKAVTDDVPEIPDDWDKGLQAWTKAGWQLAHVTGNREHGWGWLFVKNTDPDKDADNPEQDT